MCMYEYLKSGLREKISWSPYRLLMEPKGPRNPRLRSTDVNCARVMLIDWVALAFTIIGLSIMILTCGTRRGAIFIDRWNLDPKT